MKYALLFGTLLGLTLLGLSCSTPATSPAIETGGAWATSQMATRYAEAAKTIGTLVSPTATMGFTPQIPVTGGTMIETKFSQTYGTIVVDDQEIPVYLYTNDTRNGGTSACANEACTLEWPPVTTVGMPIAGRGVRQELLGIITRRDGIVQATYNGWPLYYADSRSTDSQGKAGRWFLVTAQGNALTP